jgi:L-threonylcarbamoyladenylate synthase
MNELFADDSRKAAQGIREGKVTAIYSCWGWVFVCDAASMAAADSLLEITAGLDIAGESIVIDNTGKLNRFLKSIPEFADEIMSFSEHPLIAWFDGALNVSDKFRDRDGAAPFMIAHDDLLSQAVSRCGKTVYARIPAYQTAGIEEALKKAGCVIPLQRRRTEPFQHSEIRFRTDGTFQLDKKRNF